MNRKYQELVPAYHLHPDDKFMVRFYKYIFYFLLIGLTNKETEKEEVYGDIGIPLIASIFMGVIQFAKIWILSGLYELFTGVQYYPYFETKLSALILGFSIGLVNFIVVKYNDNYLKIYEEFSVRDKLFHRKGGAITAIYGFGHWVIFVIIMLLNSNIHR